MSQEIWIAQTDDKKLVFVGMKSSLEAGMLDAAKGEALARLIANSEGKDLKVLDGHQASSLMHTHQFKEYTPTASAIPKHSPIKPIQDRKNRF